MCHLYSDQVFCVGPPLGSGDQGHYFTSLYDYWLESFYAAGGSQTLRGPRVQYIVLFYIFGVVLLNVARFFTTFCIKI